MARHKLPTRGLDYDDFPDYVSITRNQEASIFRERDASRVILDWAESKAKLYSSRGFECPDVLRSVVATERESYLRKRREFVKNNMRLAAKFTFKLGSILREETPDDLFPQALEQLFCAFEKYDSERGFRFSTFYRTLARNEFARYRIDKRRHVPEATRGVSLDGLDSEGISALAESLSSNEGLDAVDLFKDEDEKAISEIISFGLGRLSEREKLVVEARFGLNGYRGREHTLTEVGRMCNMSRENARLVQARALRKLSEGYWIGRAKRAADIE